MSDVKLMTGEQLINDMRSAIKAMPPEKRYAIHPDTLKKIVKELGPDIKRHFDPSNAVSENIILEYVPMDLSLIPPKPEIVLTREPPEVSAYMDRLDRDILRSCGISAHQLNPHRAMVHDAYIAKREPYIYQNHRNIMTLKQFIKKLSHG